MQRFFYGSMSLVLCLACTIAGCKKENNNTTAMGETEAATEDHSHDHDTALPNDQTDAHGEATYLGLITIEETTFEITLYGDVAPRSEAHLDIHVAGGPLPTALRVWIGEESGIGSLKTRAEGDEHHYHAHVETPDELSSAALWVEIETSEGKRIARHISIQ